MELVLKNNELEKAAKLAIVLGINAQQLLEQAGDILLTNKEFPRAVACYKLSKVNIRKMLTLFPHLNLYIIFMITVFSV